MYLYIYNIYIYIHIYIYNGHNIEHKSTSVRERMVYYL